MTEGMAVPGYVYVGANGRVKEAFFEQDDLARYTANNVIAKLFPELVEADRRSVEAPHVGIALSQSDRTVVPGSRIALRVDVTLPADVHVYASSASHYKPIRLELEPHPHVVPRPVVYPAAKSLLLPAIKETVPVFEGKFQIRDDVLISLDREFMELVGKGPTGGTPLQIRGTIDYQACDAKVCFPPDRVLVLDQA